MNKLSDEDINKLQKVKDKTWEDKEKIINWIVKKQQLLTIGEISRRLDKCRETVVKLIGELNTAGYDIELDAFSKEVKEIKKSEFKKQLIKLKYRSYMKVGLISDTHLGSVYQQLSLLHDAYDEMVKEEVDVCLHCGDLTDGPREMHKRSEEVFLEDTDNFIDYANENYPKVDKFKTYILDSGTHDTFFKRNKGVNIVRRICEKRNDLVLRRGDEAEFSIPGKDEIMVKLVHPTGGIPYAKSYRQQKYLENLVGDFLEKIRKHVVGEENTIIQPPHIFCMGHYHTYNHLEQGGVECFLLPCFQSQTPYLRDKGHFPNVGFVIATLYLDQNKVVSKIDFTPFRWNAYIKKNDY